MMPRWVARRPALTATVLGAGVAAYAAPVVANIPHVRERVFSRLAGVGDPGRVALTFDDGPNPRSTPRFAEALALRDVRATFFLLGCMVVRAPGLTRALLDAGHELAVHGWTHRSLLARGPRATHADLARTHTVLVEVTGVPPRFFRPPYGQLTTPALLAARRLGLTPVLWSCWGKDWGARATPQSVLRALRPGLAGGATVLLHDSVTTQAPDAWRVTLAVLPRLLDGCVQRGWQVGPLRDHFGPAVP
jgi:peptidoglycan/xylan/chitin deacetylase (PgdA/CDA1 family)